MGSRSADTIKLNFRFRCGPKRRQEATGLIRTMRGEGAGSRRRVFLVIDPAPNLRRRRGSLCVESSKPNAPLDRPDYGEVSPPAHAGEIKACEFVRSKSLLNQPDSRFRDCGFAADNFAAQVRRVLACFEVSDTEPIFARGDCIIPRPPSFSADR